MPIPFADNFMAGALLSLLLPICLLIAFAVWYVVAVRRVPDASRSQRRAPTEDPGTPPPES
ncbi:MAG TPA: hypothetical protein VMU39_05905 [Solirubrobacteraceae bacterium]|nr:hypothetical protein [Solirubrobacteraceae bacterium]